MPRCTKCCKRIGILSFRCRYCEAVMCANHRLPEDHMCRCLDAMLAEKQQEHQDKMLKERCVSSKIVKI